MVIQRWQSVLLLIAAVMMASFTFVSLGQIQLPDYTADFTTLGFKIEGEAVDGGPSGYAAYSWPLFAVSLVSIVLPVVAIFCYKNFRLQKSLCMIELLFIMTAVAIAAIYGYNTFAPASVSWSSCIIAPLIAFVADIYAYIRIRGDQKKLRAADRLR